MKREYRSLLAIVLSLGVLLVWYTVIAPPTTPQPQAPMEPTQTQSILAKPIKGSEPVVNPPSLFSQRKEGRSVSLENELVRIVFDTMGGIIKNWELKKFTRNEKTKTPTLVSLAESEGGSLDFSLKGDPFEIQSPIPFEVLSQRKDEIVFQFRSQEITLLKKVKLKPDSYQLEVEVDLLNNKKKTLALQPVIGWSKMSVEESPQRGILFFKTPPDHWSPVYYKDGSLESRAVEKLPQEETIAGKVQWVGAQSRYFLMGIVPLSKEAESLKQGIYRAQTGQDFFYTTFFLPTVQVMPKEHWIQKFLCFGGPKEYEHLKEVGSNLDKAIGYGWTSAVAIPILFLLKFFYKGVQNYGLAIILLTIFVKILLNPINRKSLKSMKALSALQPRLKEIREKHGKDKERMNLETMQLFKSHKVNPMGGCLPMALQIPIYIALYQVLWNSVELYHAPFFGFYKDLSAPDPYLISPLLLGVTMYLQTKMTPNPSADPAQQKIMLMMPLMFCGFMIFLPMGLVLYILVNTLMTILQQWMYQKGIRFRDLIRGRFQSAGAM